MIVVKVTQKLLYEKREPDKTKTNTGGPAKQGGPAGNQQG
jgi:hypothetical protein